MTSRSSVCLWRSVVEAQLGWLEEYRENLEVWAELCEIDQASCSVVRRHGYSNVTLKELKAKLGEGKTPVAQELIGVLVPAVQRQCALCEGHPGRLPGSSEVIESLIGKGKRLLGTSQYSNSLTGQFLNQLHPARLFPSLEFSKRY